MANITEQEGFSLKKFLFGKIERKITVSFIILSFCIILIESFIFYQITADFSKEQIKDHVETVANLRAGHIETYFDWDTERIGLITSRTQLKIDIANYTKNSSEDLKKEIITKLNDSRSSIEEIECICFINLDGNVVVCDDQRLVGRDYSQEDFFINGKMKEGAYFFKIEDKWKIIFSAPISQNDKLLGVIITSESTDELNKVIEQRTGLGQTGEVLIAFIDKTGNIVYPISRLFENESSVMDFKKLAEPMKNALEGKSVFFESALDYRNVKVIAASTYIPSVRLGLVAKIDWNEVILPIRYRFIRIFIFSILFIFILALFIINILSKKITTPIRELITATEKVSNKDFKARVNIKSHDELEELAKSFNKTTEILENLDKEKNQIDKAKTEFLSITSHELRSPMTPMKAQLQMVLGNYFGKLNKEQRESLQIVLNNTERLDKIIVDFLEISRIEAARLKFSFIKADLTKTINSVVNEMKGFMPEKKIKIETKIEKLPIIEVDPDRVSQVLRNLINNAIKFTPENGKIEVSAKVHSGMILFSVKDNGLGISEKNQRRLFEPFYQVTSMYQHKGGGTGLGLAISRGIVESQNGKIWLISQEGNGTIFYFTIPLKPVREIRGIRMLLSKNQQSEDMIKSIFQEYIGPLGVKEFEDLSAREGITLGSLMDYIGFLVKKGILTYDKSEEFKNRVILVLSEKEEKEEKSGEAFVSAFKD